MMTTNDNFLKRLAASDIYDEMLSSCIRCEEKCTKCQFLNKEYKCTECENSRILDQET